MKKKIIASMLGILLVPLALTGCGTQKNIIGENDAPKITYVVAGGDIGIFEVYVLTQDYTLKRYDMSLDYFHKYDVFVGELPPEGEYRVTEYQIFKEDWNALINAINENNFAELPEELSGDFATDGTDYYVQVETADWTHKTGGYLAGYGEDEANKRFNAIQRELNNITHPYPMPVE